jgi:hypothetical protein
MPLLDLWTCQSDEIRGRSIHQIQAFAGGGVGRPLAAAQILLKTGSAPALVPLRGRSDLNTLSLGSRVTLWFDWSALFQP